MPRAMIALLLGLGACSNEYATGTELWAADLPGDQLLLMTLVREGDELNGQGFLSYYNSPAVEPLTLTGTRVADTVAITFLRGDGDPFRFNGWYLARGTLDGKLDGGEFVNLSISFRRR
jgi:hypothetical protein